MTREGERAVPVDFEAGRLGLAFAWSSALGPTVAVLPTAAALAPVFSRHLAARPHVTDAAAPRLAWLPDRLAVGWVEDGIGHGGVLDASTGDAAAGSPARAALGPAHGVAVADAGG